MSVTDGITASPAAPRPAPPAGGPPARPRPPFKPVSFTLGAAGALALLVGQYYFESAAIPALEHSATLTAPLFSRGPLVVTLLLVLRVLVNFALLAAAAVVFFRWTLRQIHPMYHAQVLITLILAGAHFYYGVLESFTAPSWLIALTGGWVTTYSPTFVAIAAAVAAELVLGRLAYGKWVNPASAYVTGISAGILIKSPELWPFVLCAVISIASKYALRLGGRHLWNPTNFGITVMLLLASQHTASLSVQYGNVIWANVLIWTLGGLILWKIGKLHIPVTFAAVYLLLSPLRAGLAHNAWLTEVAPLTGPMYQLYMCFMITDPKTTTHKVWTQCLTAALVAVAETGLRLAPTLFVAAPELLSYDAPYIALFVVGPAANLVEVWATRGKGRPAAASEAKAAALAPAPAALKS
jgi:enediyne biosynthesis protein E5